MAISKKKIWITASNGFIGRNFLQKLNKVKNKEIIYTTRADIDFTFYDKICKFLLTHKPDVIIQTAGIVGGISRNKKEGYELLSINNTISNNLIRATADKLPKTKFINFCSSCIYPNTLSRRIRESDFSFANIESTSESYAISKIIAYKMCNLLFQRVYNFINIIPSNLYGPFDNFNSNQSHVIPGLITKLTNAHTNILLMGSGKAKRDFLYIDDLINAVIKIINTNHYSKNSYNLSSKEIISIKELALIIKKLTKIQYKVEFANDGNDGAYYKCLDSKMFRKEFKWSEKTNLRDGLKKTISWYNRSKPKNF